MGGNTRAIDRKTGVVLAHADKIDLRKVGRRALRSEVCNALVCLDHIHLKSTDEWLWPAGTQIADGFVFNGSSEHLFDTAISDEDLISHKPVLGDIDVTIPHERLSSLFETLAKIEAHRLSPSLHYVGQNKCEQHGHQINALFKYNDSLCGPLMIQIDFEGTEYVNGRPTPFSKFAHSSAWDDICLGLKGVGHKYWLVNLVRAISENASLVQVTDKSPLPPSPVRLKKMAAGESPRTHAFSVDRGLRNKMKPIIHDDRPFMIDGKIAVRELPTAESEYIRDLSVIYEFLFDHKPSQSSLKKLWSLAGLVDLCKQHVPDHKLERAYVFMLNENMFGQGAQKLDRVSRDVDEDTKMRIVNFLKRSFPSLKDFDSELERLKSSFYARY